MFCLVLFCFPGKFSGDGEGQGNLQCLQVCSSGYEGEWMDYFKNKIKSSTNGLEVLEAGRY